MGAMIETERLILRRWREADREPYAAMSADPEVMRWLGRGPMTRVESDAQLARFEASADPRGLGFLAAERRADGALLGYIALAPIPVEPPVPQGWEIGWRLARPYWREGYASEGAATLLAHGFAAGLTEVLSLTAASNLRSRAVMRRIGLRPRPDLDFEHPRLSVGDSLRSHVVYGLRSVERTDVGLR
ncbi:MAG: GNAT family N-acetyltransferase [Caulobacteraceae bacterium]